MLREKDYRSNTKKIPIVCMLDKTIRLYIYCTIFFSLLFSFNVKLSNLKLTCFTDQIDKKAKSIVFRGLFMLLFDYRMRKEWNFFSFSLFVVHLVLQRLFKREKNCICVKCVCFFTLIEKRRIVCLFLSPSQVFLLYSQFLSLSPISAPLSLSNGVFLSPSHSLIDKRR